MHSIRLNKIDRIASFTGLCTASQASSTSSKVLTASLCLSNVCFTDETAFLLEAPNGIQEKYS